MTFYGGGSTGGGDASAANQVLGLNHLDNINSKLGQIQDNTRLSATSLFQSIQNDILTGILDAQSANATPFTDDTNAYFYKSSTSTTGWVDLNGNNYTPVGTVSPVTSGGGITVVNEDFVCIADNGIGVSVGDAVAHIVFYDGGTQVADSWKNVSTQTFLTSVPAVGVDVEPTGTLKDINTKLAEIRDGISTPTVFTEYVFTVPRDTAVQLFYPNPDRVKITITAYIGKLSSLGVGTWVSFGNSGAVYEYGMNALSHLQTVSDLKQLGELWAYAYGEDFILAATEETRV